ncbi:MAG: TfuA-like protein [Myxococcales bacterium]
MTVVIFCGPTLRAREVRAEIDAEVRPPAGRGDVVRAALDGPSAIGLIDGYFARVPSVWHKEILWTMSQGIHVFGAASMGALRAAELHAFGMEGVGTIFEQYRDGLLVDDDEVAVVHATDDRGYQALSEAMVNGRATLSAAERAGAIDAATRVQLESIMKGLHYPDRCYPRLFEVAEGHGVSALQLGALRKWLPEGRIDQKRQDALSMLRRMRQRDSDGWIPKQVTYRFARTDAWEALRTAATSEASATGRRHRGVAESSLIDELLGTGKAVAAFNGALARALCLEVAQRTGLQIEARAVETVVEDFRRERGLLSAETFDRWIEEQHLDQDQLTAYFQREAIVRRLKVTLERELLLHLTDHLRETGEYGAVKSRAAAKQADLAARGMELPELAETLLSENELWRWYFRERLHREVPANLQAFAQGQNADLDHLRTAVLREYCYQAELARGSSSKA